MELFIKLKLTILKLSESRRLHFSSPFKDYRNDCLRVLLETVYNARVLVTIDPLYGLFTYHFRRSP